MSSRHTIQMFWSTFPVSAVASRPGTPGTRTASSSLGTRTGLFRRGKPTGCPVSCVSTSLEMPCSCMPLGGRSKTSGRRWKQSITRVPSARHQHQHRRLSRPCTGGAFAPLVVSALAIIDRVVTRAPPDVFPATELGYSDPPVRIDPGRDLHRHAQYGCRCDGLCKPASEVDVRASSGGRRRSGAALRA